jgi:hypothetical protein
MSFSDFDASTKALVMAVYDDAWMAIGDTNSWSEAQRATTTTKLTSQLLYAANAGERDPIRLKAAALRNL